MCRHFFTLIALAFLLPSCHGKQQTARKAPPQVVRMAEVQSDTLAREMTFVGYLQSNFSAVIQPRVNGYLLSAHFQEGMPVRKGQRIFTLDAAPLQTTRLSALASLESARAQLLEAQNNYERAQPLARLEAISQTQMDQYTAQYAAATAAVRSAEQSLRSAELEVGYTQITAPIDGIIASTSAHAGDYVGPGTQFEVLTTISNLDTLSVDLAIPMNQYLLLGGDREAIYENRDFVRRIRLRLSDGSLYGEEGTYNYTHEEVSTSAGTLLISVNFPNPRQHLKAGQFARVEALVGKPQPLLLVPQRAVSQQQGSASVWVVRPDSTVEYRSVVLGDTYGEQWAILSGLKPGEWVVEVGLQKLQNGERVTIQ